MTLCTNDKKDKQYLNSILKTLKDFEGTAWSQNLKSTKKQKQPLICEFQGKQDHHNADNQERDGQELLLSL
jgi:hypothetical protein